MSKAGADITFYLNGQIVSTITGGFKLRGKQAISEAEAWLSEGAADEVKIAYDEGAKTYVWRDGKIETK